MRLLRITNIYFSNSLQSIIAHPAAFWIFFISKFIRYGLFFSFLYFLSNSIGSIGGYTSTQMLMFYLVFSLVDTTGQMLFREVYRFRPLVLNGGFDGVLAKPFPALLRVLVGGPDYIDMGILVVLVSVFIYMLSFVVHPTYAQVLIFLLLFANSLIVSTAIHILVLGIGIMTLSVDHLIMIYRDLSALLRIPIDFFSAPIRAIFTFVIPLGVMFTFPAKGLLGLLNWQSIVASVILSFALLYLSYRFWHISLKHYQSASS